MLGDINYKYKDKISKDNLLHVVQVPTLETTITDNTIINNIDITKIVTYHSNSLSQVSQDNEKILYSEGQNMKTSKDRTETTIWNDMNE
jgi:hypothetical protein